MILDTNQILTLITNFVKSKNPQVDVQPGTDLYDVVFQTNATVVRALFEAIQTLQNNQAITTTVGKDLDLIAKNYNVTRRPSTYSTGQITFYATDFSQDILIPINTVVSTAGNNVTPPIRFVTTQSAGMSLVNKATYFDSTALRYQVKANIISTNPGSGSNVDALIVSQLVGSISGIQGVINDNPITGATDQETDVSVQQRCLQSFVSSAVGTLYGYGKLLTDTFPEVLDVNAVGPFDAGAIRPTGVDLFTLVSEATITGNEIQTTESFQFVSGNPSYIPIQRPVLSIDKVSGTVLGSPWTFIPYPDTSADYKFVKDTTGANATSTSSADQLIWLSGIKPDNLTNVLVTYTYNNEVQKLQTFMNQSQNKVVGASALIKTGFKANVTMTLTVVLFPTADPVSARTKVTNAINQYLNSFVFGETLELSDLILVAQSGTFTDYVITEVDYVLFNQTDIWYDVPDLLISHVTMTNDSLTVSAYQYLRPYSIVIQ